MVEDSVSPLKATILQHETNKVAKVNTESVAKPAIMRAGADGKHYTSFLVNLISSRFMFEIL